MSFLAKLAMASYHLIGEVISDQVNDVKAAAQPAYSEIVKQLRPLTSSQLPTLSMVSFGGDFGPEGLRSGIYTNQNAAAFAARSKDALFISFRGTNDNTGEEGPPNPFTNTPDESHWVGKKDHLDLFADLFSALSTYVGNLANGISTVYVVGHSLGGGMVEGFMDLYPALFGGVTVRAATFASSGYGAEIGSDDTRIGNLWLKGDPILAASKAGDNEGDENVIYHDLGDKGFLHSMALYVQFVDFLRANGIDQRELSEKALHGIDYDRYYINAKADLTETVFSIATFGDTIDGSDDHDVILGGAANDSLSGYGGQDHIVGGTQADTLNGGKDDDFLYGGDGRDRLVGGKGADQMWGGKDSDVFVFGALNKLANSFFSADMIVDFKSTGMDADVIDLSQIDAIWGPFVNQAFVFIGTTAFSPKAGELRFQVEGSRTVILGDTNGDAVHDLRIVVEGVHALEANDFVL